MRPRAATLYAIGKPRLGGTALQIRWSCATGTHAPWSYLSLAEPEGLSGGCGIGAIGSGPAA